jgi:hypothetical protein
MTVQLLGPVGVTRVSGRSGAVYNADANGLLQVDPVDVATLLNAGCLFAPNASRMQNLGAVPALSATSIVAATALVNGALTIAAQPGIPRRLSVTLTRTSGSVTAGVATLTYKNQRGETVVDAVSLITGATVTLFTTQAVAKLTSAIVSGVLGTFSMTIQMGTTDDFGIDLPAGAVNLSMVKAMVNNADSTLPTTYSAPYGWVTSPVASDGTKVFGFVFSFVAPMA